MADLEHALVGKHAGEDLRLPLHDGRLIVGRSADCDLVLPYPSVSRRHAALLCSGGQVLVEDMGSHNGTRVNDVPVAAPTPLRKGDAVAFADILLHFGAPSTQHGSLTLLPGPESAGLAISWDEVAPRGRTGQRKRAELFQCLAEAGDLLTRPRAPQDLFEPILDLVESAMEPERAFLLLADDDGGEPRITASRLHDGSAAGDVVLSRSVVARVLEERTSFLLEDEGAASDIMQQQSIISQGIRSAMATPLFNNESVIGILYADTTNPARRYTRDELVAFSLLANVIAVALTHARLDSITAEKRRLDAELGAARAILEKIIPAELPSTPGYELCAHIEPCFEVGGDLYDVTTLPDGRVAVTVGDVSGKGLGAALLVSSLVPMLRAMLEKEQDLAVLAHDLNRQLWRTTDPIRYATLFTGILDPATGRLDYVNAGHNPPVVVRCGGHHTGLPPTGLPIALMPEGAWKSGSLELAPGNLLALSSDGISETWRDEDHDYGDERFQALLGSLCDRPVTEIHKAVLDDVAEFRGDAPVGDDVTLLLLKRLA